MKMMSCILKIKNKKAIYLCVDRYHYYDIHEYLWKFKNYSFSYFLWILVQEKFPFTKKSPNIKWIWWLTKLYGIDNLNNVNIVLHFIFINYPNILFHEHYHINTLDFKNFNMLMKDTFYQNIKLDLGWGKLIPSYDISTLTLFKWKITSFIKNLHIIHHKISSFMDLKLSQHAQ